MAKLKSTIKLPYKIGNPYRKAFIEISFEKWIEDSSNYFADVTHYAVTSVTEEVVVPDILTGLNTTEIVTYDKREFCYSNRIIISEEKYNQLTLYANSEAPAGLTPKQMQEYKKAISLFAYVTSDFLTDENGLITDKLVYDTTPLEWEMI